MDAWTLADDPARRRHRERAALVEHVDVIVAGAGVVGLAVARALAETGRDTLVLEREALIGSGASARNSEVIHAGLYYPTGSLKARLCVEGKRRLYAYARARGLAHERCGKLVVATSEAEAAALRALATTAHNNGVHDVVIITGAQARAMEPAVSCAAALHSPSTGIIDSHAVMLSLQGDVEQAGGLIALRAPVMAVARHERGFAVHVGGDVEVEVSCRIFINSAGLDAPGLAARMAPWPAHATPRAHYAKGSYFALRGRAPFRRLIYPAPEPGGLGVHFTRDLAGQGRFGPDVEWVAAPSYDVDPQRAGRFYAAVRRYWPDLPDDALQPDYAGVRAKLAGPGAPAADFAIHDGAAHGAAGLIQLFGIESPGLTAALALGDYVRALVAPDAAQRRARGPQKPQSEN